MGLSGPIISLAATHPTASALGTVAARVGPDLLRLKTSFWAGLFAMGCPGGAACDWELRSRV